MMSRSARRFTCGLFNLYWPTDWLEKIGMEEIYLINRATRIVKRRDQLSITFRGNVNSIGPFIPFMLFCMTGFVAALTYVSNSIKIGNILSHPTFYVAFITSCIAMLAALAEITLKYEIIIDRYNLLLRATRLNIKSSKVLPIGRIIKLEKAMVKATIGDTGSTKVLWPHICIHEASTKHTIPVTLDEDHVDDIIKLMQEFIAGSNA
jgi:hypothetical protein